MAAAESNWPSADISTVLAVLVAGVTMEKATRCALVVAKMLLTRFDDETTGDMFMIARPGANPLEETLLTYTKNNHLSIKNILFTL